MSPWWPEEGRQVAHLPGVLGRFSIVSPLSTGGSWVRIRNEKDAVAAYLSHEGDPIEEGWHVTVDRLLNVGIDEWLWDVWQAPDEGVTHDDARTIFGPEGKVWTFSRHPGVHDDHAVRSALWRLYDEGVQDLVDPESLAEQVQLITRQMLDSVAALPDAARRGLLRRVPGRHYMRW